MKEIIGDPLDLVTVKPCLARYRRGPDGVYLVEKGYLAPDWIGIRVVPRGARYSWWDTDDVMREVLTGTYGGAIGVASLDQFYPVPVEDARRVVEEFVARGWLDRLALRHLPRRDEVALGPVQLKRIEERRRSAGDRAVRVVGVE